MAEIGFIGLGRMGSGIVSRLVKNGVRVVVNNRSKEPVHRAMAEGAIGSSDMQDMLRQLPEKKVVWMMLPAGEVTEAHFQQLLGLLKQGDIIIDGANSNFHDTVRRHEEAAKKGIDMLDAGVSGGILAKDSGYPLMVGGKAETYEFCRPIFEACGNKEGFGLVGPAGAGHFVKMVHNAIEYGMMQSIAEGFDLMSKGSIKGLDLKAIAHIWNHGTIIESLLMKMAEQAIASGLDNIKPYVDDSGEGRWAALDAMENSVPFVSNTYALHSRYISRDDDSLAFRLLSAIRREFGGHQVIQK